MKIPSGSRLSPFSTSPEATQMPRYSWFHPGMVFFVTLAVYFWSAPSTVTLEDDGYFIMAAWGNGIAHPPGYPLYTLLAHLATLFPAGSVALRVHTLSMVFSSLACLCLWQIGFRLFREKAPAYLLAFSFGFSPVFWSQSVIAEVYSLQLLLFTLMFLFSLDLLTSHDNSKKLHYLKILYLLTGLGLGNHWPLLLLSMPCLVALLWPQRRFIISCSYKAILYILPGLLPYFWMVYRSRMSPEISFFGSIDNIQDLWFYISRKAYADIDTSISAGLADKLGFIIFFLRETAVQFSSIGGLFVLSGLLYQWRIFPRNISIALLLGFLCPSLGLILLLGFDYDFLHRAIFRVYPLVSYWVAAIWAGTGVMAVALFLVNTLRWRFKMHIVVTGLAFLLISATFYKSSVTNFRAGDTRAKDYATRILESLPKNAILFVSGDTTVGPVGYMHLVEKLRSDIDLYSLAGTLFRNRLYEPFKVNDEEISRRVNRFINSTSRPVFYNDYLQHDYGWQFYGLYYRLLRKRGKETYGYVLNPGILDYLEKIHDHGLPQDDWEQIHYRSLLEKGCSLVYLVNQHYGYRENARMNELENKLCSNLLGQYIQLNDLFHGTEIDTRVIQKLLRDSMQYMDQALTKEQASRLDYFRGMYYLHEKKSGEALKYFRQCIDTWPDPDNPAYSKLAVINRSGQSGSD